jgi:membrane-bound serine protease (ClpP class)
MITSIILACYLLGLIGAKNAAVFLFVSGLMMIASEFMFPSGIIAFSGLLGLYVAYSLEYGQSLVFGVPLGWGIFFGIAAAEALIAGAFILLILRHRRIKASTGTESMIGHAAEIIDWTGHQGRVRIQGEIWKAASDTDLDLQPQNTVTVEEINNLILKIKPK